MVVRFDDNACALIGKNGEPLGTRINGTCELCMQPHLEHEEECALFVEWDTDSCTGVVGAELRDKQWSKILSLASSHV